MNNTVDLKQLISLWMTAWQHVERLCHALDARQVQEAIRSINSKTKHPFWQKLSEAFWTLVRVPEYQTLASSSVEDEVPGMPTSVWLKGTCIEVPASLAKKFAIEQLGVEARMPYRFLTYRADDFQTLAEIGLRFPSFGRTPLGNPENVRWYPLPYIATLIQMADIHQTGPLQQPNREHIFIVAGKERNFFVGVRKKLNQWKMREVGPSDSFRSESIQFFA